MTTTDLNTRLLALLAPDGPVLPPETTLALEEAHRALRESWAQELRYEALLTMLRGLLDRAEVPREAVSPDGLPYMIPLAERLRWLISAARLEGVVP